MSNIADYKKEIEKLKEKIKKLKKSPDSTCILYGNEEKSIARYIADCRKQIAELELRIKYEGAEVSDDEKHYILFQKGEEGMSLYECLEDRAMVCLNSEDERIVEIELESELKTIVGTNNMLNFMEELKQDHEKEFRCKDCKWCREPKGRGFCFLTRLASEERNMFYNIAQCCYKAASRYVYWNDDGDEVYTSRPLIDTDDHVCSEFVLNRVTEKEEI